MLDEHTTECVQVATYGTLISTGQSTNGGPAFTGFTGVLGNTGTGTNPSLEGTAGRVSFNGLTQDDGKVAKFFRNKANQPIRMLLISMIGAAPGALASKTFKRVLAQSATDIGSGNQNIGGLVPIETATYINRTNTVNDDNALSALFNRVVGPAVYAVDPSGATGGGKAGVAAGNVRNTGYF